mgnify:FL=1
MPEKGKKHSGRTRGAPVFREEGNRLWGGGDSRRLPYSAKPNTVRRAGSSKLAGYEVIASRVIVCLRRNSSKGRLSISLCYITLSLTPPWGSRAARARPRKRTDAWGRRR